MSTPGSNDTAPQPNREALDGEQAWLERAQAHMLAGKFSDALAVLTRAAEAHPQSPELQLALAGALAQCSRTEEAEAVLLKLLNGAPADDAAAFLLARLRRDKGLMCSASQVINSLFQAAQPDIEQRIEAVELLDDCGRQADAAAICESAIAAGASDPRMHVHAAALASQLGQFERARQRYEFVLQNSRLAPEWHVPLGLAGLQRYQDDGHPDFGRFSACLLRNDLSAQARASLLFALGKAYDDIGCYADAADHLRRANGLVRTFTSWPRKQWRRSVDMRLRRTPPPTRADSGPDWTPVFIVGLPRAGSTLLAERLARHPDVRHRGELSWMPKVAEIVAAARPGEDLLPRMQKAELTYEAQMRQDDAPVRWYIDKQPHNFMHVDLILALFPRARIIHCRRDARDNALSLWMQSFHAGAQDFAYDFADMATVIHGSRRLMTHWQARYPDAVCEVRYEDLVNDTDSCLAAIGSWLALPTTSRVSDEQAHQAVSTASLWQVRQPIHTRSVQRWRHYAELVPELAQISAD